MNETADRTVGGTVLAFHHTLTPERHPMGNHGASPARDGAVTMILRSVP